jgi:serine/threonine protein kinase/Tol biopolymer transport system component
MGSERWREVEEVYHAAMERPRAERSGFVAGACRGDADLEREVRSLLEQKSAPGFLSGPAMEVAAGLVDDTEAHWKGRRIGVYTLDALLGRGGMGEVYRARDTRLGRDVAIKVLPQAFTSNPDRLARFEREARLLAALNHPHIGMILGVEEGDHVLALVLELVEGDTLADRIARGPVAIKDALDWARQIADALDAAHEKGIVHRDLKPANIKITPQGVVKVLDFGLARAAGMDSDARDMTRSPAITASSGMILGTAAYMSPEQARGQAVDKRADVWAFGCVLYELLTGRSAFAGPTVSDTLASILQREPDWTVLPADVPPPVRSLLRRCLEKDPRRRRRDIGDVRAELDDAIARPAPADAEPAIVAPRSTLRIALLATAALAGAIAIAAGTIALWPRWQNPLENAEVIRLTDFPGAENDAAISPDGRLVVFLSDRTGPFRAYFREIETSSFGGGAGGGGELVDVTPEEENFPGSRSHGIRRVAFTRDSSQIWFAAGPNRRPRLVPTIGRSAPQQFLRPGAAEVAWSPDGKEIVYYISTRDEPETDSLFLADSSGANPVKIYKGSEGLHNHGPVWGLDGKWIYFIHGRLSSGESAVWRIRASRDQPQEPEALTHNVPEIGSLAPLDARTLLYVARAENGSGPWLWALDVEAKTSGRVLWGVEQYTSISGSEDGRQFVASVANPRTGLWSVPILDRVAGPQDVQPHGPGMRALAPRSSGKALFYLSALGTGDGLWRFQDGQTTEIWKGSQGGLFEPAAVSPDGLRVAIVVRKGGRRQLTVKDVDGGELRTLADSIDVRGAAAWSPDGKSLVVGAEERPDGALYKIPVDGGQPIRLRSGFAENPAWSPRGDLIVFVGPSRAGQSRLVGIGPDGHEVGLPEVPISAGAGPPRFLPDGSGIVYSMAADRRTAAEFWLLDLVTRVPRQLAKIAGEGSQGQIGAFDVTPDGRIIFDRQTENSDVVLIRLPR